MGWLVGLKQRGDNGSVQHSLQVLSFLLRSDTDPVTAGGKK